MLKQVIYLSSSIDENEMNKSLSSFGEYSFDVHYFSALELAEYLLQLSGVVYEEKFISNEELSAKIYAGVRNVDEYFKAFSFNDICQLVNSLADLRSYIVNDEQINIHNKLPKDKFIKKNNALLKAYDFIIDFMHQNHLIDEIGIIRFALANTKTFPEIDFRIYEKSHLHPLELALINKAAGKEINETPICQNKKLNIKKYVKAFGQVNEIEYVLSYIYENDIPFDQCIIASADSKSHANSLITYHDILGFPLTIGLGKTILETPPGKLFSLVDEWKNNHYHLEYLLRIVRDESFNLPFFKEMARIPDDFDELNKGLEDNYQISFDTIIDTIGRLKISFDSDSNDTKLARYHHLIQRKIKEEPNNQEIIARNRYLEILYSTVHIFSHGLVDFIKLFSVIRDEKTDINARNRITNYITYSELYGIDFSDIEKKIKSTDVGREKPKEGSLYFTSIRNASSNLRKYLFIIGLNSNTFPGKSSENPLILDRDYEAFSVNNASNRGINDNKDDYFSLLEFATKHDVEIILSYASYNSQTLKNQNSSSVVFETYRLENGEDKTIDDFEKEFTNNGKYQYIEYFDKEILPTSKIGKVLANNNKIQFDPVSESEIKEVKVKYILESEKGLSASAVTNYAKCPYLFYLSNVLKVPQPEEIDIYQIIPANECGTLAHSLLEHLDKSIIKTKEQFMLLAGQAFDEYLIMNPPDNAVLASKERKEFIDMMGNAYQMEGYYKTVIAEEDVFCVHAESGVRIHGFPDKVIDTGIDYTPEGALDCYRNYVVIDYKTGRTIKHDPDDVASMIQCTMYSYIFDKYFKDKGMSISSFEYWYIRNGEKVYCVDDNHTMQFHYDNLTETLKQIKNSLETGIFKPDTKHCGNCYYNGICIKKK